MAWSSTQHAGHPFYAKEAGPARSVLNKLIRELPTGVRALLVHTRAATQGHPRDHKNNHPISVEDITLTHNGRCANDWELFDVVDARSLQIGEVDSEAIAWLLSRGPEILGGDVTDLLSLVEGTAALAWFDLRNPDYSMINLARLRGRPLAIGWTKRGDLVYASTPEALELAGRIYKIKIRSIFEVEPGVYYQVHDGEIIADKKFVPASTWTTPLWKSTKPKSTKPKVTSTKRAVPRLSLIDRIENELVKGSK